MLTSKDCLKEVQENTLGDGVIRIGRKYLEFPNSCLVKGVVKIGRRNIFVDGIQFSEQTGVLSVTYTRT
jgi:hypothetical protein